MNRFFSRDPLPPVVPVEQPRPGSISERARAAVAPGPNYLAGLNPEQRQAVESAFAELEHEHPFEEALALYEGLAGDNESYPLRLTRARLERVLRWLADQLEVGLPELLDPVDEVGDHEMLSSIADRILAAQKACLRALDELGADLSGFERVKKRHQIS